MSKIVIIGAGAMGSAFALPCLDNNHDINIVGTHLENNFIDDLQKNKNLHPGLNTIIPKEIKIFKFEKLHILRNLPRVNHLCILFQVLCLSCIRMLCSSFS